MPRETPVKMESLQKMEAILKIIEESVTKQEFLSAIKQLVTFVEGIKKQNESEFALLKEFFDAATGKLNSDTSMTLKEMKAGMNELFIGEKLAEMKKMVDGSVKSAMEKMHKKMMEMDKKMATVKDGYTPKKGKDYFDGKHGNVITPIEVRNKIESLKDDERLDKSAIKGLDEIEQSVKEIGSRRVQTPAKAYQIRTADVSSQCDGIVTAFSVGGSHFGIIGVFSTQFPTILRPVIDYTETRTGIQLTGAVSPPATGQTLIIQYIK